MSNYEDLNVWKISHKLVLDIYKATVHFPKDELYGLTSQIRRAAYSIPCNIAEGYGRGSDAQICQFLIIAKGSASELEYELLLAKDLGYLEEEQYIRLDTQVKNICKMLTGLIRAVKAHARKT
jgi:four helix bundle protein